MPFLKQLVNAKVTSFIFVIRIDMHLEEKKQDRQQTILRGWPLMLGKVCFLYPRYLSTHHFSRLQNLIIPLISMSVFISLNQYKLDI